MAAATTFPDDFSLESELLQFVDDHASFSVPTAAAQAQTTATVDDLLNSNFFGLESIVEGTADICDPADSECINAIAECDRALNVTAGFGVLAASTTAATDNDDAAFSEFLINGEEFLNEMEKVVKMDMDTNSSFLAMNSPFSRTSNSSSSSSSSPRNAQDLDIDALTDADVMSSPCPSSCPSSKNEFTNSPARGDFDDLECTLLKGQELWGMPQEQQQEQDDFMMQASQMIQNHHGMAYWANPPTIDLTAEDETEAEEDIDVDVEDAENYDEADVEYKAKNDAELLQKEAKYLEAQYDYLLSRAKSSRPQRTNIKAKRGRGSSKDAVAKSTQDGKILNELVSQQQVYLDNFKAMLSFAPVNDVVRDDTFFIQTMSAPGFSFIVSLFIVTAPGADDAYGVVHPFGPRL